jgi:hypothetical protein
VGVLQCTTAYPCPPEKIGLNMVPFYRERYGCWAGLADHSATIYPGLAGAALGLDVLEVHVALSRDMFGPDVIASVTTAELRDLVDGIRFIETMRAHPVDKETSAAETAPLRRLFTRSLVARQALAAGTVLTRDQIAIQEAGHGPPPRASTTSWGGGWRGPWHAESAPRRRGHRRAVLRTLVSKRKICVVITARPSYSRIRTGAGAPSSSIRISSCSWSSPPPALLDRYGSAVRPSSGDGLRRATSGV